MPDPIWTQDFNVLFKQERLMEFFPIKDQTNEERVNAIVRLSLYISICLAVYNSNVKYFSIFLFFLGFTFIIYRHHPEMKPKYTQALSIQDKVKKDAEERALNEKSNPQLNNFIPSLGLSGVKETLEGENRPDDIKDGTCTKPTVDNPFMNVTMKDYMNFDEKGYVINRPSACDPRDQEIKKMMDKTFSNNLYRDVSDVFGKNNSQRNYFTMPSTTIPNKQDEFARWLYLSPKTCKEDQDYCLRYEDIRSKRFVMPNTERNPLSSKKENLPSNQVNI
jgi:hypothetical protein